MCRKNAEGAVMDTRTFFILSDNPVTIERLHLCSWDFGDGEALSELGLEFIPDENDGEIIFKISFPFDVEGRQVTCLMDSLVRNDDNCKFIFNDKIVANKPINADKRNGSIVEFSVRNTLAILPISDISAIGEIVSFRVKPVSGQVPNYIRFCLKTKIRDLAVVKSGIAKCTYIYDVKINEQRNMSDCVNKLINRGFAICTSVKSCFCFHVVPSKYNISYLNSSRLKNIRVLESEAFSKYLPLNRSLPVNDYMIVFNKDSKSESDGYAFFSEFDEERIGVKQLIVAVVLNILCNLLFAFSSITITSDKKWYLQLPIGYWVAIGLLVVFSGFIFWPATKLSLRKDKKQ